jgi:hypothetical protein
MENWSHANTNFDFLQGRYLYFFRFHLDVIINIKINKDLKK